jgi:SAM-dependent methyltransferase
LEHSGRKIEAVGIEPSVNFSKFARGYTGADIYNGTLDTFCEERSESKFDLVILNHVLEHFLDPTKQLKRIHRLMNDDGLLFVEVPDILGEWAGAGMFHLAHVYQFCEMTLRNILAKAGFSPIKIAKEGNHLHPWAMTFIVKKDPDAKVILPSKTEIKKNREIIIEKLIKGGALPPQKPGFLKTLLNQSRN